MSTKRENFYQDFEYFQFFYVLVIQKLKKQNKNFDKKLSRSVDMTLKLRLLFWREAIEFKPTHS